MTDETRRELERLKREYDAKAWAWAVAQKIRAFCSDEVPQHAINAYAASHKKMAITACSWCGCDCRQFPWLLDKPSTCQICKVLNG